MAVQERTTELQRSAKEVSRRAKTPQNYLDQERQPRRPKHWANR